MESGLVKCNSSNAECIPSCPHKEGHPETDVGKETCRTIQGVCTSQGHIKVQCVPEKFWRKK